MEAIILTGSRLPVYFVDNFISLIWTERYSGEHDFELVIPASSSLRVQMQLGRYLRLQDSKITMIIESIEIMTDPDGADVVKITGRGIESLMYRRVLDTEFVTVSHNLWQVVATLMDQNITSMAPASGRALTFLNMGSTPPVAARPAVEADTRFTRGSSLYEQIMGICLEKKVGFRFWSDTGLNWLAQLYAGTDRSESQTTNFPVIFSPEWENFESGTYLQSFGDFATFATIEGELWDDDTATFTTVAITEGAGSGVNRHEIYVDQTGLSSFVDGIGVAKPAYLEMLKAEGRKALAEHKKVNLFEGTARPEGQFVFNQDYFLGDVVTVKDKYGNSQDLVVSEFVRSEDRSGYYENPTFRSKED